MRTRTKALLFHLLIPMVGLFAQQSYIQIKSEPGISVYLDGVLKGVTDAELEGIIIKSVAPGSHSLKFTREGFAPLTENIVLSAGEVYIHQVKPLIPQVKISQKGNKAVPKSSVVASAITLQTGSLKIQSLPVSIRVGLPELGIDSPKDQDEWRAEDIPVGTYQVYFKWKDKSMTDQIAIEKDRTTEILVDFIDMKVQSPGQVQPVDSTQAGASSDGEADELALESAAQLPIEEIANNLPSVTPAAPENEAGGLAEIPVLVKPVQSDLERYHLEGAVQSVQRTLYSFDRRDTRNSKILKAILESTEPENLRYVKKKEVAIQQYLPNGNRQYATAVEYDPSGHLMIRYNQDNKILSTHFWQYRYDEAGNRIGWGYYERVKEASPHLLLEVTQEFSQGRLTSRLTRTSRDLVTETFKYNEKGDASRILREAALGYPRTSQTEFQYLKYDEKGNWVERHVLVDGLLTGIERRTFQYFNP